MYKLANRHKVASLFESYDWNYMAAAILDGHHGEVLVDDLESPEIAVLRLPSLNLMIVGGDPASPSARSFCSGLSRRSILFFVDRHEEWVKLGREYHGAAFFELSRYAFTSNLLDPAHIHRLRDRPLDGLVLAPMGIGLATQLKAEKGEFAEDHLGNFASLEEFTEKGFGFVILDGDEIVSVASTFVVCDAGIEIQINTRKKYQDRGLGTVVGAALIAESLERGLDPNWDAASERSAGLARKFGYTDQGEYKMVIVFGSRLLVSFLLGIKRIVGFFKKRE